MKFEHEFRDPIHGFISISREERRVVDSWPFQRLRHIHQLAMTYLVYPGATHRRFEHSLGVMELASIVYRVITTERFYTFLPEKVRDCIPQIKEQSDHWYRTLRMAALCHDLGHLPFSHANEDLLPCGYTHERMTWELIHGEDLLPIWKSMYLEPDEIGKLALGPRDMSELDLDKEYPLNTWEILLSEIIVGDGFGVDRMDYLLRDSHHLGVSYGTFDLKRVLQGLRIAYNPPLGKSDEDQSWEPVIGVEQGALHAATALLWARYSIFSQVYFHHVRRIYDMHLRDFMKSCYQEGYPIEYSSFLSLTDNEILAKLHEAARTRGAVGHEAACRLVKREHFRCIYRQSRADVQQLTERGITEAPAAVLAQRLRQEFGENQVMHDVGGKKHKRVDFPVLMEETLNRVLLASQEMPTINNVPNVEAGYIFVDPKIRQAAKDFLISNRDHILNTYEEDAS